MDFAVDNEGNVAYARYSDDSFACRIRTANGTTIPLDDKNPKFVEWAFFTGIDGYIYGHFADEDFDGNGPLGNGLYKLEIMGNTLDSIVFTPVTFDVVHVNEFNGAEAETPGAYCEYLYYPEKLLVVSYHTIWTFYRNGMPKRVTGIDFGNSHKIIAGTEKLYVLSGGNKIETIDPETGAKQIIVPNTKYDLIYRFEVSYGDIVIINALTYDGKKVLANIYPDGREEILSEHMEETERLILQKITAPDGY